MREGEGFQYVDLGEIQELTDTTPEELREDDLTEKRASQAAPDDEEEDVEEAELENKLAVDNRQKGSSYSRLLLSSATWTLLGYRH